MHRRFSPAFIGLICLLSSAATTAFGDTGPLSRDHAGTGSDYCAVFDVFRGKSPIGRHEIHVHHAGEQTTATIAIDMKVKIGPIKLFSYKHRATEVWRNGELMSMTATTKRNKKEMWARAWRRSDGLHVEGSAFSGVAPTNTQPTSYWNTDITKADHLLNTQNGEIIPIDVHKIAGDSPAPGGEAGEHYRLLGSVDLQLWYQDGDWIGSNFSVDGEEIIYKRAAAPSEGITAGL